MASYSIKDLEKLTGIKAHTIRIWEQRYHLISPQRTDTNIRYYSDEQAKRLLKVCTLYHQGMKISRIASMNDATMNEYILDIELTGNNENVAIEKLTLAMIDLSEEQFLSVFNQCIEDRGFKDTIVHVVYPFLQKTGVMWQVGDIHPAQEHFISNLIRQKIIARIDRIYKPKQEHQPKVILFLPEGELHELGLLFYSYLLQEMNYHVIYLGQSVPENDLFKVAKKYKANLFLSSVIAPAVIESFSATIINLFYHLPHAKLYLTGAQSNHFLTLHPSVQKLSDIQDLERNLPYIV